MVPNLALFIPETGKFVKRIANEMAFGYNIQDQYEIWKDVIYDDPL